MPAIADIADRVLARVEGCPEGFAIDAIRDAAIEFCRDTYIHTRWLDVSVSSATAPLVVADEQVLAIVDAKQGEDDVCVLYLNDDAIKDLEDGQYAIQYVDEGASITVTPAPTVATVFSILVATGPTPESTTIRDDLWRRHHEALVHGALARLYADVSKPWANGDAANYRRRAFDGAKMDAQIIYQRNRSHKAQRLRVRPA